MSAESPIETIGEKTGVTNPGMTLAELIHQYKTDRVSTWRKLRYATRRNHETLMRRMIEAHGDMPLSDIRRRTLEEWYLEWSADGKKISSGHAFMGKLRTIINYGAGYLEDMECARISIVLSKRKDPTCPPRQHFMTAEQAIAVRNVANQIGWRSIALAQAFQFDLVLRQGDCIGQWVPISEPGESNVVYHGEKWVRGLRWSEIDGDLILRHVTSKTGKILEVDLKLAPMVMEEIQRYPDYLKTPDGPVIISETKCLPWKAQSFRQRWRKIADIAGVPKEVKSMDSRSGGITEGTDAGMSLDQMRHAATHSSVRMTGRYDRNTSGKVAESLKARAAYRQARGEQS